MSLRASFTLVLACMALAPFPSRSQSLFNPTVALASTGQCAVASNAAAAEGGAVLLSLLDDGNRRTGAPEIVNRGMTGYGQNPALVCAGPKDLITLVWEQWNGAGISSIYRAQYAPDGKRLTQAPECVLDSSSISAQTPRIAAGADGRAVVVWLDYRLGRPAVYAQRYTKDGKKEGRNIRIADGAGSVIQTPAVCIGPRHEVGFIWQETIRDSFRVVVARAAWNLKGAPRRAAIDRSRGQAYASTPDIAAAVAQAGAYCAVWKDYRTGESNIFAERIAGRTWKAERDSNLRLNDDTTHNWQRLPRIAASPAGMLAVWEDYRNDVENQIGDIYAQVLDARGAIAGTNFRVSDATERTVQRFPAVAMNARGEFVVVWSDSRAGRTEVYLRRGNLAAKSMEGTEVRVAP